MSDSVLLFRVGSRVCALRLAHIEETMRPLSLEPINEVPDFVAGAAIVRGMPTPVVDAGALLTGRTLTDARRWVLVKSSDDRRVALQVSSVLGVYAAEALQLAPTPPLLRDADPTVVEALGRRDDSLLGVLQLGHVIPDDVFSKLAADGAPT